MTRSKKFLSIAVAGFATLTLAGCGTYGWAYRAVDVKTNSATMQASIQCDSSCQYYFKYRAVGSPWQTTPIKTVGAIPSAINVYEGLSGLPTNTNYEYQLCIIGQPVTAWTCSGRTSATDFILFHTGAPTTNGLDAAYSVIRTGPTGRGLVALAQANNTTVTVSDQPEAKYYRTRNSVVIGNNWFADDLAATLPGVLAHELGHSNNYFTGVVSRLESKYGVQSVRSYLGDELVAEMVASAAAAEGRWTRGGSSITTSWETGSTMRTPRDAVDFLVNDTFYQGYYGYTAASFTEAMRNDLANTVSAEARTLIQRFGGTVPSQFNITY